MEIKQQWLEDDLRSETLVSEEASNTQNVLCVELCVGFLDWLFFVLLHY